MGNYCIDQEIKNDLGIPSHISKYNSVLLSYENKVNSKIDNRLKPLLDVNPVPDAQVTEDLTDIGNSEVESMYEARIRKNYEAAKELHIAYKDALEAIEIRLKATPTERSKAIAVSGSYASDSTLMKNIPGMTDKDGNLLTTF